MSDQPPLVNCIMLVKWPERRTMIQEAIESFCRQTYAPKRLTVVNSGQPCALSADFLNEHAGAVVQVPAGTSIGEKRNAGARAAPEAQYIASFDDDDVSLPWRLGAQMDAIGPDGVWHRATRWFIALDRIDNIVGFEYGSGYGASLISAPLALDLRWPDLSWCEDHALFKRVTSDPALADKVHESGDLWYVHRRHATNASAAHRDSVWQNVLPLPLAGSDTSRHLALVKDIASCGQQRSYLADAA
mmetsp:Transcript_24937/g.83566  ORF Transcript_24937/g.83566 Transcript_24937/m.83566 type:complete len:245 (-) Transcript_24937:38-772(-)